MRLSDHVEHSERKVHDLKLLMKSMDNRVEAVGDDGLVNTTTAAYAGQLLLDFTQARKKQRAIFEWFSDLQAQRKSKSTFIVLNRFSSMHFTAKHEWARLISSM